MDDPVQLEAQFLVLLDRQQQYLMKIIVLHQRKKQVPRKSLCMSVKSFQRRGYGQKKWSSKLTFSPHLLAYGGMMNDNLGLNNAKDKQHA